MAFQATNTADHILVVEGETNLPAGSPIRAELQTREGQVMLRDRAVVSHSKFYFDFDLQGLDGLSLYLVKVRFDPQTAPLGVRQLTGLWGEALEGQGVRDVDNRRVVERQIEVILTAGGEGKDWEGRDFGTMEVSERARIIAQLEKVVEEKPQDRNAKLALARAYIAADARELASGTRAFALLKEVSSREQDDNLTTQALKIVSAVETKETKSKVAAEQRKTISRGDKFKKEKTIWPGRSIGAFTLGTSYRILARHLKLDQAPDFSDPQVPGVARPKDFPGLELRFNSSTRRMESARTTSTRFTLPEGYGVGSLLQELQQEYGKDAVPSPKFQYEGTRADGRAIFRGTVLARGLEFEIVREVDPVFGLPLDKVVAITVFRGD
jgi:hypothetical protein